MTDALVVMRAQAKRQKREEEFIEEQERLSGTQPKQVVEETQKRPELTLDAKEESGDENKEKQLSETEAGEIEFTREIADLDEELFQGG